MLNTKYVVIIEDGEEIWSLSQELFQNEHKFQILKTDSSMKAIKEAMLTIPDLVIINEDCLEKIEINDLIIFLRKTSEYAITPIILVSQNSDKEHKLDMLRKGIEFYIKKPLDNNYFLHTIKNVSRLISANRCISALTGLPGNVQIENELKRRIASRGVYAVLYIDLDNFKAYNDKYGFMNGDEVIKFTSDIIQDSIQRFGAKGDFLGHVGGDDFVAVVDYENAKLIGKNIIKLFDEGITKFYTQEDIEKGWVRIPNRKGKLEKYPIMTVTVAMISNKLKRYANILEIGEEGANVKKKAKALAGSNLLEDRRKTRLR